MRKFSHGYAIIRELNRVFLLALLLDVCGCSRLAAENSPELLTVGWLEQIMVSPPGIILHAKLDTGADNCSIHADNITAFTEAGVDGKKKKLVTFTVENRYGERKALTREIIRTAKIKTKDGGFQRRPVVRLDICIADYFQSTECNLVDRSHFAYPVLIGRNFLAGNLLVHSADTYMTRPGCNLEP